MKRITLCLALALLLTGWTLVYAQAPAIISPPDGSVLKSSVQTFTWSGGADEYWLLIGTSPGGSDLYAAHFGGEVTQHRFSGLPLDGRIFFVQLRSRAKNISFASTNHYTAPVRKGLCLIVDFQNAKLEDWKEPPGWNRPPGLHNEEEVKVLLDQMSEHWEWLSRGIEKVQWDLKRVQLPRDLAAFPVDYGYRDFRYEVMANSGIAPSDYDVDSDGVVDSVWMVVSSQGYEANHPGYEYLTGGAALVAGVKSFLDAQCSFAVSYRRYGAFNHEFAHNLGLPDLYGHYSTVEQLSLMGNTVEHLPGADFSAFDREKLGWLKAPVIAKNTRGIFLPPASEEIAAVRIPTDHDYEYFLLEYRKTPESGYGSVGTHYDGLAVYHVLTPSVQGLNPPLLKIEAADGFITPDTSPSPDPLDLFYPENPVMDLSLPMRSYLTNEPVFRIQNVRWASDGIEFDVKIMHKGHLSKSGNLTENGSFEKGEEDPDGWTSTGEAGIAEFEWTTQVSHRGRRSVSTAASDPTFSKWLQPVEGLISGRTYLLCGWMKGQDIVVFEDKDVGANILLSETFERRNAGFGTFDWTKTCMAFEAPENGAVNIACGLGGWGSTATGKVWCDDFCLYLPYPSF